MNVLLGFLHPIAVCLVVIQTTARVASWDVNVIWIPVIMSPDVTVSRLVILNARCKCYTNPYLLK